MIRARWVIAVVIGCVAVGLAGSLSGCSASDPTGASTVDTEASLPTTTIVIVGEAAELLPEMAVAMSQLSAQVAEDGDAEEATLATIVAIWTAVKPEVDASRPQLVSGLQTTVDMATSAVERKRPADADKAYNVLTELIDRFNSPD